MARRGPRVAADDVEPPRGRDLRIRPMMRSTYARLLFDCDRATSELKGDLGRSADAGKRIEHKLAVEREQLDQPLRDLCRKDRRVLLHR